MDLMQMLPLLMMMQGGNKKQNTGSQGGMDMATMLQLMSMMNGGSPFGNAKQKSESAHGEPLDMDMSKLQGMLSPEMLALLSSLGRKS